MASLSTSGEVLVIRLVYDGPAQSGKTSSLRTLAGSLARRLESPEEADGRTLFFDWVDYVGGSFEGLPIRCQIVSVPGQRALASRRRTLLAEADAIVFVADSTRAHFAAAEESLAGLRSLLAVSSGPHPGIVVQANKRDQGDALPLGELRSRAALEGVALVESVAVAGTGIREAFVLAVRLALDRVRELKLAGALRVGPPAAESATDLLRQMREVEAARGTETSPKARAEGAGEPQVGEASLASDALREVLDEETRAGSSQPEGLAASGAAPPLLPDSRVPSGRVWPPIEGRILLHDASLVPVTPRLLADGSWGAQEGAWWLHSAHEFRELDAGKEELLRWAQLHAGNVARLSPRRCLVLSEAGPGSWRLWQIVESRPSLRQQLKAAFRGEAPGEVASTILEVSKVMLRARSLFAADPALPCLLEVLGEGTAQPTYVGLLPPRGWVPAEADEEGDDLGFLRRVLGPSIRRGVAEAALDVPRVLTALSGEKWRGGERARLIELLSALLIGH